MKVIRGRLTKKKKKITRNLQKTQNFKMALTIFFSFSISKVCESLQKLFLYHFIYL